MTASPPPKSPVIISSSQPVPDAQQSLFVASDHVHQDTALLRFRFPDHPISSSSLCHHPNSNSFSISAAVTSVVCGVNSFSMTPIPSPRMPLGRLNTPGSLATSPLSSHVNSPVSFLPPLKSPADLSTSAVSELTASPPSLSPPLSPTPFPLHTALVQGLSNTIHNAHHHTNVSSIASSRAIVTTDISGTVSTANDRFTALVAALLPPDTPPHKPQRPLSTPTFSCITPPCNSPPLSPVKRPVRKGFQVFDLEASLSSTPSNLSSFQSSTATTPYASPARRFTIFGSTSAAPTAELQKPFLSPPLSTPSLTVNGLHPSHSTNSLDENNLNSPPPKSVVGTSLFDLLLPLHRDKLVHRIQRKLTRDKFTSRSDSPSGRRGSLVDDDVIIVAGRIVRLQRQDHGKSIPVSLWIKARHSTTSRDSQPVLLWVMEEINEVALHCIVRANHDRLAMTVGEGPWSLIFPHSIVTDSTQDLFLTDFVPGIHSAITDSLLTVVDKDRFFSARDPKSPHASAFPVLIHRTPSSSLPDDQVPITILVLPHLAGMLTVDDRATIVAMHPGLAKQLLGRSAKRLVGEPLSKVIPLLPPVIHQLARRSYSSPLSSEAGPRSPIVDETPAYIGEFAKIGTFSDGPVVSAASVRRLVSASSSPTSPTTNTRTRPGKVYCMHRDGGPIDCDVQVRPLATLNGHLVFSLWVQFDHAQHRWPISSTPVAPKSPKVGSPLASSAFSSISDQLNLIGIKQNKSLADYDLVHAMGEGAYGHVQLTRDRRSNDVVALKLVDKDKIVPESWTKRKPYGIIPREIAILADLLNEDGDTYPATVVRMIAFWEGPREFGVEMAVHGSGLDLFEYIERTGGVAEEVACRIFYQVSSAVAYLHSKKIVHRDIKDENVVLDDYLNAQLIDFGSAVYARSSKPVLDTFAGTLEYCAPELILGERYQGKPQDVWALGILLYVMLFRECPFFTDDEVLRRSIQVPVRVSVSSDVTQLLKWVLSKDLAKRPPIEEIMQHAWFNSVPDAKKESSDLNPETCPPPDLDPASSEPFNPEAE